MHAQCVCVCVWDGVSPSLARAPLMNHLSGLWIFTVCPLELAAMETEGSSGKASPPRGNRPREAPEATQGPGGHEQPPNSHTPQRPSPHPTPSKPPRRRPSLPLSRLRHTAEHTHDSHARRCRDRSIQIAQKKRNSAV